MIVRLLTGRLARYFDRPGLLAISSGAMIALSFPNPGLSFLVWVALIPLLIALEESSPQTAFRVGMTCGVTAYALILYWLNIVFTRYGHLPWSVSIPVYLLLVLWLAMFYGLSTCIARLGELIGIKAAFTLPVAWVAFDFIRSFLFSGFAWAMLGHSQYRTLPLIQIADLAGVYGITLLIVLANIVLHRALRAVSGAGVPYPVKSGAGDECLSAVREPGSRTPQRQEYLFEQRFHGIAAWRDTRARRQTSSGAVRRICALG
jgi:apolipoprotein N-acyltransferase